MILEKFTAENIAKFDAKFQKAFEFIAKLTPDAPLGKTVIDSSNVYANIMEYDTQDVQSEKLEFHKEYVDIQILLSGAEKMIWADRDGLTVVTPYNPEKDVEFRATPKMAVSELELVPGLFAVFFPEDGHYGKLAASNGKCRIKKAVVKVKI